MKLVAKHEQATNDEQGFVLAWEMANIATAEPDER
jgi:hypothetical protein